MQWPALLLLLLPALAVATDRVLFTQPLNTTIWMNGTQVVVQWVPASASQPLSDNPVIVELMYGPPNTLTRIGPLGWAKASDRTLSVTVSNDLISSTNYSVRIQPNSYSDQFAINNTGKPTGDPNTVTLPELTNVPSATGTSTTSGAAGREWPSLAVMGMLIVGSIVA